MGKRVPGSGWLEYLAGEVALRALALAGRRALARGDKHEVAHILAGLMYANSTHRRDRPCLLTEDTITQINRFGGRGAPA